LSHKLSSALWDLDIDGPEREVLSVLCYYADDDGTNCYPGMVLLIWKLGKSESQTQRILKRLEGRGIVTIVQRGLGRGNGSEYTLDLSKINPKENCPIKKPRIQAIKPTIQEIKPSIGEIKPPIQDTEKVASSTGTKVADSKEFLLPKGIDRKELPQEEPDAASTEDLIWIFRDEFQRLKKLPYRNSVNDQVAIVTMQRFYNPSIDDWRKTLKNYFATPNDRHWIGDLCDHYDTYFVNALDKYRKPVEAKNAPGKPKRAAV